METWIYEDISEESVDTAFALLQTFPKKVAAILQPLLCFLAKILQLPGWLVCTHIHKQDDASSGLPVKLELNRMNITRAAFSFYFDMLQWI